MIELLQIPIDQVNRFWPLMATVIERALPPGVKATPAHGTRLLRLLLTGAMQAWAVIDREDEATEVTGYAITQLMNEDITGLRNVLIYALAANEDAAPIRTQDWLNLYTTFKAYARANGAMHVTAYTANERLIRLADDLGGDTSYHYVVLEVQ